MNLMKMLVYFHWAAAMLAALIASCCFAATFDEANVAYQAGDFEKALSVAKPFEVLQTENSDLTTMIPIVP